MVSADKKLPRLPSATKLNMLSEQTTNTLAPLKHSIPLVVGGVKSNGRPSNRQDAIILSQWYDATLRLISESESPSQTKLCY